MKKAFIVLSLFQLFFYSCTTDENGQQSVSPILVAIIIFIIGLIFYYNSPWYKKQEKEKEDFLKSKGLEYKNFTYLGTYTGGHPSLDDRIENVYLIQEKDNIVLYKIQYFKISLPEKIYNSEILISDIDDITIEDSSSIEKKITLGRVILVGIFALAWRKKKKNELSFVNISWKKGKFQNNTIFCIEGKDAFTKANTARNKLITICSPKVESDDWFKKEFDN